eukprot:s9521_g2.t1
MASKLKEMDHVDVVLWNPLDPTAWQEASQGVRPQLQSADLSVDAMLAGVGSDVDLAVVARAAADGHQEDLWDWLHARKALLKKCNTGSLAAILSGLTRASQQSCRSLLRHVAGEMLQAHRRLSPRHALVMLASLKAEAQGGNADDDEKPVSVNDLLEKVFATLNQGKDGDGRLLLAEIVPAMEALAVLRSTTVDAQREQLLSMAKLLVWELRGGLGLADGEGAHRLGWCPVEQGGDSFPGSDGFRSIYAVAMGSLVLCADRLLALPGAEKRSRSWWLAAIAQSGEDIQSAAGFEVFAEHAPTALIGAVSRLGPDDPSAAKVRALWALHALGKVAEHQDLAESLLKQLQEADFSGFSPESWWLLRELQPTASHSED